MAAPAAPILYTFRRCPYAIRARLALAIASIPVEVREVLLRDKPAALLHISPKATVPVLHSADGMVIDESLDIMRWALAQNDPQGWLASQTQASFDWIAQSDDGFKPILDRYKYHQRHPQHSQRYYRRQGEHFLSLLEQALTKHRGLGLVAERYRLVDFAVFPFVRQFAGVEPAWFKTAPYPLLRSWLTTHLNDDLFQRVMLKYPRWSKGASPLLENWRAAGPS